MNDETIWLEDTPATYVLLELLAEGEAYLAEQDKLAAESAA